MKASKLSRIGAFLLDLIFISLVYSLLWNFIPGEWIGSNSLFSWGDPSGAVWYYAVVLLYFLLFDMFNQGDSLGKELLRLQTRDAMGQKLTRAQGARRSLLKLVSYFILPVSALLYLFGKGEFSLHDAYFRTGVYPCSRPMEESLA